MNEVSDIKGHLILLVAPTGSGKGMLHRFILETFPEVKFAVSCTTRAPREGEKDGVDYHYISKAEFKDRVANGDFIEWAEFGGNMYGTLKSELVDRLRDSQVVLNEIEIQGVTALKKLVPEENLTTIYVEAGGWDALQNRAKKRAPISAEELELRRQRYLVEKDWKSEADHVIENYDGQAEKAKEQTRQIIGAIIESVKAKQNNGT